MNLNQVNRKDIKQQSKMLLKTQGNKFLKLNMISIILNILYFSGINVVTYNIISTYSAADISKLATQGQSMRTTVLIMGFELFVAMIKVGVQYSMLDFLKETGDKELKHPFNDSLQIFSAKYFSPVILLWLVSSMAVQYASYLFIIPGVILYLMFSQIYFVYKQGNDSGNKLGILATFSNSVALIKGFKMQYLLLDLSFLGWDILNSLTFGLLSVWLVPYKNMTYTMFYKKLIEIKKGEL
ncbi:membrane protein [Companilactobacillus sp. RD055328]|uniref:DUF975 family protein n=1 Tax=Companilactobacillus sp. RD055328 TaxID=2916634 RepID=UPI001FC8CEC0|nr:DUF975 family protein [Companilactobacillus sp. RD055328]GKQ43209.1 membrane protein [Companilactobacillus sp. RD055328]